MCIPSEREVLKLMMKAGWDEDRLEQMIFPFGPPDLEMSESESTALYNRIVMRLKAKGIWEGD